MRVLMLHLHDKSFQMGGADRGVLDLACALKASHGDDVRIAANAGPFLEEAAKRGVETIEIPHSKTAFFSTLKILNKEIESFRPEILHSHHRFMTFVADLFFRKKGVPVLHTQRVQAFDKRFLFRAGDFVTTVSDTLRSQMIRHFRVPENRIRAIINAVPSRQADLAAVERLKIKFPRQQGQLFALCAGRFHAQKGHAYLIEAVSRLPLERRKRLKIFLAGDGPLEKMLRLQIGREKLEENFVFLGYREEIPDYLALCDFFILSSLWEGLPRSVLEAFAAGKPAVATDIPGTADVLENGRNGLLVRPGSAEDLAEALSRILAKPEDLAGMQKAALESSKKYSFETMVRKYHELYMELAGKKR